MADIMIRYGMSEEQPNNPLHGITLEAMLVRLVGRYGWEGLARRIPIRAFTFDPSVKSSLTFLRRTPWAREKVERLYLRTKFGEGRRTAAPAAGSGAKGHAAPKTRKKPVDGDGTPPKDPPSP